MNPQPPKPKYTIYQRINRQIYLLFFSWYINLKDSVKDAPWYMKDSLGWPIEIYKNKPIKSVLRVICQNIRKITG